MIKLALLALTMLAAAPAGGQPPDAPGLTVAVPDRFRPCDAVQVVTAEVDNTGRPARDVVFQVSIHGVEGSPGLRAVRVGVEGGALVEATGQSTNGLTGRVAPPVRLAAGERATYRIEVELYNEGRGFDLDLLVDLLAPGEPDALAKTVTKLSTNDPILFVTKPRVDAVDAGGVVEFTVDLNNPGLASFPLVQLTLRIDPANRSANMGTLRVEVAEGDHPWRPLRPPSLPSVDPGPPRITYGPGPGLEFADSLDDFNPLSPGAKHVYRVRLHLDPDQPGSIKPEVEMNLNRPDRCPASTVTAGFELRVRQPDPAAAAPFAVPAGALAGAGAVLGGFWLWTRRRAPEQPPEQH